MRTTTARVFVLVIALVVAMPMLVQVVLESRAGAGVRALDVFRRVPTATSLRAYEKSLSESLVVASAVRPRFAELMDRAFRRGNGKVVVAKGDWLYYAEDFRFLSAPGLRELHVTDAHRSEVRGNRPFETILEYKRQLDAAGIALVLVAIPEKATIVPERLTTSLAPDSAPNNRELVDGLERLAKAGVFVVELTAPLLEAKARGVPVFLPLDTHWSPEAAKLSARFVADRVRGLPAFRALAPTPAPFNHRFVTYSRRGDLYQLLAYADRGTNFFASDVTVEQVLPIGSGPRPISRESPVLVLGDSFTVIYGNPQLGMGKNGGFAEHLADELGTPVDVIAIPAGGPNRSREALALREDGVVGKRILVWQFAERDLLNKDVEWTRVPLPQRTSPVAGADAGASAAAASRKTRVRTRLAAVSQLPERLPYADCLVVTRHEPIGDPGGLPSPFYVATWGRREWKAATNIAPVGTEADITVVPLRDRLDIERTCFADTVGLKGQLYWAEEDAGAK